MLGRVSSSYMSVFSLAQTLGLLLSGHLAVWFGIRVVFLMSAAAGSDCDRRTDPAQTAGDFLGHF